MKREKRFLEERKQQSLLRNLPRIKRISPEKLLFQGEEMWNFSSNDYLGLSHHPKIIETVRSHLSEYGVGSGSSRLLCGTSPIHQALEEKIAQVKKREAALTYSTGYMTGLGVLATLIEKEDMLFLDEFSHASLLDGAKMSRATWRPFRHNDMEDLEKMLKRVSQKRQISQRFYIITESIFSMDGDVAPIEELVFLKKKYEAFLLVDEAHQIHFHRESEISREIDLEIGTLSKTLGSAGGYVAGDSDFIQTLIQKSRPFIYSTAPPPIQALASLTAIEILETKEGDFLQKSLQENIRYFSNQLKIPERESAIFPWIIGGAKKVLKIQDELRKLKMFVPAIRYPTVKQGTERLRISLMAQHSKEILRTLATFLK